MAVAVPPAAPRIDAAANCAEPANVVADITIGAIDPIPAEWASTPKVTPKAKTAIEIGAISMAPSRYPDRGREKVNVRDASAPSSNAVELLGREHQARGRTRSRPRLAALARARVDSGAACSRARSRHVLLDGALHKRGGSAATPLPAAELTGRWR